MLPKQGRWLQRETLPRHAFKSDEPTFRLEIAEVVGSPTGRLMPRASPTCPLATARTHRAPMVLK